jgi:hypothetical protein
MGAEAATLVGMYIGSALACFLGPFVGAVISRRFKSVHTGVVAGTLLGGSAIFALNFIVLGVI